ncbi:MAG: hypothetical protein LBD09_01780 [Treponema sp.]|jgi:hypothetical protein|nr:hypothetical protein [Treponema sp.]
MMKKTITAFLVCALAALGGCNKTVNEAVEALRNIQTAQGGGEAEQGGAKLAKETRFYNDYLGVSFAVPKGFWLYEVNGDNFGESKGDVTDEVSMDISISTLAKGVRSSAGLVSFGNLEDSRRDNHLGFDLYAQSLEGKGDMASFMEYYEAFMLEPTDEADYEMLGREQLKAGGKTFEVRIYLLDREDDDYHILTATCPVKNGYFFNVEATYWPENTKGKQAILDNIAKNVAFY